jgi:hypothetical protein
VLVLWLQARHDSTRFSMISAMSMHHWSTTSVVVLSSVATHWPGAQADENPAGTMAIVREGQAGVVAPDEQQGSPAASVWMDQLQLQDGRNSSQPQHAGEGMQYASQITPAMNPPAPGVILDGEAAQVCLPCSASRKCVKQR